MTLDPKRTLTLELSRAFCSRQQWIVLSSHKDNYLECFDLEDKKDNRVMARKKKKIVTLIFFKKERKQRKETVLGWICNVYAKRVFYSLSPA